MPKAAAERDQVQHHGLDGEQDRAERPREQDRTSAGSRTRGDTESCRRRVDEVAFGRGARRRASPPCRRAARLEPGRTSFAQRRDRAVNRAGGAVDGGERLDDRDIALAAPRGRRRRARDPRCAGDRGCDCSTSRCEASPSTSTTKGLMRRALMPAAASASRPTRIASPPGRRALRCASLGLSWTPASSEHERRSRAPSVPTAAGRCSTSARPAATRSRLPASDPRSIRRLAAGGFVDPLAEQRQHRRQQRDRGEHRDGRDQHPGDADRADERQRRDHQREQADRDRRAGDDHRAAGVGHRLDQRGLDVAAVPELGAVAEDHQQRVVDRDAEPDERDQELDDDRDDGRSR